MKYVNMRYYILCSAFVLSVAFLYADSLNKMVNYLSNGESNQDIKEAELEKNELGKNGIGKTDMVWKKIVDGYKIFQDKYAGDKSVMRSLFDNGQKPAIMMVACSDSRVDPALLLQTDPGDLFMVRNIANIIPEYEKDGGHHGISAALEYGVSYLQVKHLVIFGHSSCGGIEALLYNDNLNKGNDFISSWIDLVKNKAYIDQALLEPSKLEKVDAYAKLALQQSYKNSMTFPWIKERVEENKLVIHLWFLDIKTGMITEYSPDTQKFEPLTR